jgi:SM-20-related protein
MLANILDDPCAAIVHNLERAGWSVTENFLDAATLRALAAQVNGRHAAHALRPARIGTGATLRSDTAVRGDEIAWLDEADPSPELRAVRARLEALRVAINERLFLGLFDLELHLTRYPAGARYGRHVDRHAGTTERCVSCILYLNSDWRNDDGGELRLYLPAEHGETSIDVAPRAGTLVTFLSGDFPHEVLPARRPRLSVTGWFRRRGAGPLF